MASAIKAFWYIATLSYVLWKKLLCSNNVRLGELRAEFKEVEPLIEMPT